MSLITYVTKIHFAENVLEDALEAELELLALTRPMIVSDHGPARRAVVDRLLAAVPRSVSPVLHHCDTGPASEDACSRAADIYDGSEADGLIAFGGGAAMNFARALGVRVSHAGPLSRYAGAAGGGQRIRDVIPPSIAVPTSAGACAEAIGVAMVTLDEGSIVALASPFLTPRVIVCDPTLTLDLTAGEVAASGMDALTHCLETYIASAYNPPADGIARDGIRRAAANLERTVADITDLAARREMMAAALNGALASQKGLGGVHAMSHALAGIGRGRLDHGAVNAALLPLVLEFNRPAVAPRYEEIRRELGLPAGADLADAIVRLRERIALPSRLGEMGVEESDLDCTAARAATNYCNRTNPRHADVHDYLSLLRAAL